MPPIDPLTIAFLAIAAVLIFVMFRNSRKVKAQQEELKKSIVPGAEIMTNFGLFGTLVSVDEVSNEAEVEVAPGTIVRVHRQTLAKVVTPTGDSDEPRSVEEAMERANREYEESQAAAAVDSTPEAPLEGATVDSDEVVAPKKKSTPRVSKKDAE